MVEILIAVAIWWIISEVMGLAALPVAFRVLGNLPDRGYTFAKPLGILLTSYLFWLLVSFRFLSNTAPAMLFALAALAMFSYIYLRAEGVLAFWRERKGLVVASEAIFAAALVLWALVRAYNPEITATEKPMEIAFLNATLRSEHFPPYDPWLSGYAISYYYFGYVIMAIFTKLSGVTSGVGFNLGIALLFALTVLGAFGLGYNLVDAAGKKSQSLTFGLLAALLVAVVGNLEGVLEVLHIRGLGPPEFWNWVDIKNLATAPVTGGWLPTDNWWWWRASRVIHDSFLGAEMEVIDEFPFFSFLLGDMHPHVLALPFTLLALALAFSLLIRGEQLPNASGKMAILWIVIGGLGFLNSWDLPTYGLVMLAAYGLGLYHKQGKFDLRTCGDWLRFAVLLFLGSFVIYLPFWVSFSSQAGGLALQLLVKTRLHQYLIIFGLFIFVAAGLLFALLPRVVSRFRNLNTVDWHSPSSWCLALAVTVMALAVVFLILQLWLLALLAALLALTLSGLAAKTFEHLDTPEWPSLSFAFVLLLFALLLALSVEFVYIKDAFGTRMNTVFKFYYQAWVLFGIASTYAVASLWTKISESKGRWRSVSYLWQGGFILLLGASLVYPPLATYLKTNGFGGPPTLEGTAFLQAYHPEEYDAMQWLIKQASQNPLQNPVILEAYGGSYTFYGRVSAYTGLPTLLGWGGHELQWRGNYDEPGRREPLINRLYTSTDPQELRALLDEFGIQYVYVGPLEREKYGTIATSPERWAGLMEVAYQNAQVIILRRVYS